MPPLASSTLGCTPAVTRPRWALGLVLGLLFAASSGDRAVLGVLKTTLAGEFAFSQSDYAHLVVALLVPYAAAMALAGGVINHFGPRSVLAACVLAASGAIAWCGGAHNYGQVVGAQIVLGLAQAGIAPAIACVILREFPAAAQASAYSIVNAIQSSATILCPPFVAATTLWLGWRYAFYLPAAVGVLFALLWWNASARWAARQPGATASWALGEALRELWRRPTTRRLVLARMVSDPLWFFFQFWQPAYLREHVGLSLADVGRIAWIPPLASVAGVLAVSFLSDRLVKRGVSPVAARVRPLVWIAVLAPAALALPLVRTAGPAIALAACVNVMCAAWLSLSAILLGALVPARLLAPSLGAMSALGCVSGVFFSLLAGPLVALSGYAWPFWIGALLYPAAALVLRPVGRAASAHG
jgi:ACS family hexuronate transporter-like MFS transporter